MNDVASANAAFMAYVHRILETSHTFSYYYLTQRISFEEMQKSSEIIKEAMNNTIQALNEGDHKPPRDAGLQTDQSPDTKNGTGSPTLGRP